MADDSAGNRGRRGDILLPLLTVASDTVAIETAFLVSYFLRFRTPLFRAFGFLDETAPPFQGYLLTSFVVLLVLMLLFQTRRMYRTRRNVVLTDELLTIAKVVSLGMLLFMSAAFFYRQFSYSRLVVVLLWGCSTLFLSLDRIFITALERRLYRKGRHLKRAIILGSTGTAANVFSRLHRHPSFGFEVIGYFSDAPASDNVLEQIQWLGPLDQSPAFIRSQGIDLAFIALPANRQEMLFDIIGQCEGVNIDFMMVPGIAEILASQVRLQELEGIPFLKLKGVPFTMWGSIVKRIVDIVVSGLTIALLSPFWILIAILIKLDSRGPVFFGQLRVGLDGRQFMMYKFRSMKSGSEQFDGQAGLGVKEDPRRTRLGVILRKLSLDELPQLVNVFKGEMSLVGPRPERSSYVELFGEKVPKYLDRHRVKTGVTGWAQVNGLRGNTSIEERVKYDLYYIENWSLTFDIKILLMTIQAALKTKGVH